MTLRRFHLLAGLFVSCISRTILAQPAPLETLRNTALALPAAALTTNGIPGLANTAPHLMVSGTDPVSAHGGSIVISNGQAWVNRYDDPYHSLDSGSAEVVDSAGNLIINGYSVSFVTDYDMMVIKYASAGAPLWTNFYNGPGNGADLGTWIGVDAQDNIYAGGDSVNADGGNGVVLIKYTGAGTALWTNIYNPTGTNDYYPADFAVDAVGNTYLMAYSLTTPIAAFVLLKYDTLGNILWTNVYQDADAPFYPGPLALDRSGNVFVTGSQVISGSGQAETVKYTGNGVALWTNYYSSFFSEQPVAVKVDQAGDVLITGDELGPSLHNYITLKYSNDGTPLWTNLLAGPRYQGGSVPIIITDVNNNVFIAGGTATANGTNADFTFLKLTSAGIPVWTNRFFETNIGNPSPAGTAVDGAGNFYFAGHSTGMSSMNIDYVTVKYSDGGIALWTNRYDGPVHGPDIPNAVVTDGAGNVYLTGQSFGGIGNNDSATVKYADNVVYTPPPNFTGTDTFSISVVDPQGNVASALVTVAVLPPQLQFNTAPPNLTITPQGLRLEVDGAPGTNAVVLLASTNLANWQPILTNAPTLGTALFHDAAAANSPRRFYRAYQQRP